MSVPDNALIDDLVNQAEGVQLDFLRVSGRIDDQLEDSLAEAATAHVENALDDLVNYLNDQKSVAAEETNIDPSVDES